MSGVQVKKVKLENIHVDEKYQRPLSDRFVQKVVNNFDEKMLGVLVLNLRPYEATDDGDFYSIVDGQHRLEALRLLGRTTAQSVVFEMNVQEEGQLFAALQKERRAASAIDQHKALLFSKDPVALSIERVCNTHGFKIASDSIASVTSIRNALAKRGEVGGESGHNWKIENFSKALKVIKQVWPNDPTALKREIIMGMWMVFERGEKKITTESAYEAFLDLNPRTVVRDAKIVQHDLQYGKTGSAAWVLADAFNKYHKLRGSSRIEQRMFSPSFRSTLARRTVLAQSAINTGSGSQNEIKSPFSTGDDE